MAQRWREEENKIIREGYESGLTIGKIADKLPHRSKHAIEMQLWKLGLTSKRGKIVLWSDAENNIIREGHERHLTHRQIAENLGGRTPKAAQAQARKLGLSAPSSQQWTEEENCIIAHGYANDFSLKEIARKLPGRTEKSVGMQALKLGICPKNEKRIWTQGEIDILIEGCRKGLSTMEVSNLLPNRTNHAVSMKIMRLRKSGVLGYDFDMDT